MNRAENLEHWERWANEFGADLRATTKCVTIKRLEIEALLRRISAETERKPLVLEIGCGNGTNGFALASRHPELLYLGSDFAPAMITNAVAIAAREGTSPLVRSRMAFGIGDARQLSAPIGVDKAGPHVIGSTIAEKLPCDGVDIAFTDRMLINLSSADEQLAVMKRIAAAVRAGGLFLMIENSAMTHRALNDVRIALGLPPRAAASYNVFIDEAAVIQPFESVMKLEAVEELSALHDLMLYAVGPSLSGGEPEYDTPLMTRLTDAILALAERGHGGTAFGQNRLWVWRR